MHRALQILLIAAAGALGGIASSVAVVALAPAELWREGVDLAGLFDFAIGEVPDKSDRDRLRPPAVAACDAVEQDARLQVLIGRGDCFVHADGVRLAAEQIVLDTISGRATAAGDVRWVGADGTPHAADTARLDGPLQAVVTTTFRRLAGLDGGGTDARDTGTVETGTVKTGAQAGAPSNPPSFRLMPAEPQHTGARTALLRPLPAPPPDPPAWKRRGIDPMASVTQTVARLQDRPASARPAQGRASEPQAQSLSWASATQPPDLAPRSGSAAAKPSSATGGQAPGAGGRTIDRSGPAACDSIREDGPRLVGTGRCRVEVGGTGVQADRFEFDPLAGDVVAIGNVVWWADGGAPTAVGSARLQDPLRAAVMAFLSPPPERGRSQGVAAVPADR